MTVITRSSNSLRSRAGSLLIAAASLITAGGHLFAASFDIAGSSTTAQTLGANQTGTVEATGSLSVSGGTVAVTVNGNNATVTNLGSMKQTGTGRVIRDNTGVTGLVVNNGSLTNSTAVMQAADADVIQMNVAGGSVTLNNYGTMESLNASKGGAQAVDFNAITTGANTINNFATGVMKAHDADAVRPGVNGVVNNYGQIISVVTTDTGSDGVDVQSNNGVSVMNFTGGSIEGARHGITGGPSGDTTFTTSVTNQAGATIQGDNGSGINLDGFSAKQTATVMNAGTIIGNGVTGDGDGVDVDGPVTLTNTGTIKSLNATAATGVEFSEGLSVGGGSITNSGTIEGLVAAGNMHGVGRGISLVGNDIGGGLRDPIYANSFVINQSGGLILGQSDCGICVGGNVASGFTVTITNQAGATIQGGGTTNAAVLTGLDNDTINESGLIDGSSSGMAINMGAGNNQLSITGGSASILGSIDGGTAGINTLSINPGSGNNFAYSGAISDFSLVDFLSGMVTLSGDSTYTGTTEIDGGILDLDGTDSLSGDGDLDLNGGTLEISGAAGVNGETFGCLSLTIDSTIDLGGSGLTFGCLGAIVSGETLTVNNYVDGPAYAFRVAGNYSTNADFLSLIGDTTVDGLNAQYAFDGTYTDVFVTPEPSTFALIGAAGMLAAALYRRRRTGKV